MPAATTRQHPLSRLNTQTHKHTHTRTCCVLSCTPVLHAQPNVGRYTTGVWTRAYLEQQLRLVLAGRAAEELVFGRDELSSLHQAKIMLAREVGSGLNGGGGGDTCVVPSSQAARGVLGQRAAPAVRTSLLLFLLLTPPIPIPCCGAFICPALPPDCAQDAARGHVAAPRL